jgi:hypothetical protein
MVAAVSVMQGVVMTGFALGLVLATAASQPLPANAEPGGIRFEEMPVGCKIHCPYSSGAEVIDVYIGISGWRHVM